jgi:hypothetical protein
MAKPAQDGWKALLSMLPSDFEAMAVEHGLLKTQWANIKVSSAAELLRFIFLHVGADLPLRQTVAVIAESGGPNLSAVWLHHRMRKARKYLAALVARLTETVASAPEHWAGYEMLCMDATSVSGPGATGTDARLHAVIRLHDLAVVEAEVTNDTGGETLKRFIWSPDQLVIADRAYANPPGIAWVVDHDAHVIVRLNRGSLPLYDEDAKVIEVLPWCRSLNSHAAHQLRANIIVKEGRSERVIAGRLIGLRLPEPEAEEARARVRSEYGKNVTEEQLEAASYVILFTTAPVTRLSAARCIEAYRLRWQIELLFKRWKSLCHFDRLPNYRDDTIQSWLTAKVLLGLLLDRIGATALPSSSTTSRSSRALAREPWKLTSIIWPMMLAAIMPLKLEAAIPTLPDLAARLERLSNDCDDRQVPVFRNRFFATWGERTAQNY